MLFISPEASFYPTKIMDKIGNSSTYASMVNIVYPNGTPPTVENYSGNTYDTLPGRAYFGGDKYALRTNHLIGGTRYHTMLHMAADINKGMLDKYGGTQVDGVFPAALSDDIYPVMSAGMAGTVYDKLNIPVLDDKITNDKSLYQSNINIPGHSSSSSYQNICDISLHETASYSVGDNGIVYEKNSPDATRRVCISLGSMVHLGSNGNMTHCSRFNADSGEVAIAKVDGAGEAYMPSVTFKYFCDFNKKNWIKVWRNRRN